MFCHFKSENSLPAQPTPDFQKRVHVMCVMQLLRRRHPKVLEDFVVASPHFPPPLDVLLEESEAQHPIAVVFVVVVVVVVVALRALGAAARRPSRQSRVPPSLFPRCVDCKTGENASAGAVETRGEGQRNSLVGPEGGNVDEGGERVTAAEAEEEAGEDDA